jgi:3-hydroxybutyryl-CoA dehydrogenase
MATISGFTLPITETCIHFYYSKQGEKMINKIGIVGAGTMGHGIAQTCAIVGIDVAMIDINEDAVQKGITAIGSSLDRLIKKGKLTEVAKDAALSHICGSTSYDFLKSTDLVIEAATENFDLKIKILKQIASIVGENVVIASNTSSISITKLASVVSMPERFIGMHFFNPVPVMGLVELIRGLQTDDATHVAVAALSMRLGKHPITVKNSPGFVINRILCPMINEAFCVLGEGLASPDEIDNGMKLGCNHPVGPLALADLIGLDTMLAIMEVLYTEFADPKYRPAMLLREMVAAGYVGRKSGRGVYSYQV